MFYNSIKNLIEWVLIALTSRPKRTLYVILTPKNQTHNFPKKPKILEKDFK